MNRFVRWGVAAFVAMMAVVVPADGQTGTCTSSYAQGWRYYWISRPDYPVGDLQTTWQAQLVCSPGDAFNHCHMTLAIRVNIMTTLGSGASGYAPCSFSPGSGTNGIGDVYGSACGSSIAPVLDMDWGVMVTKPSPPYMPSLQIVWRVGDGQKVLREFVEIIAL